MSGLVHPLKWHGGKSHLAKKIVALMPPHLHYVEPFFGGGAVLLAKDPEGVSEVVNDINAGLTNFWRVLQSAEAFGIFQRRAQAIPLSESEWIDASRTDCVFHPLLPGELSVERALAFFVFCRQSMAGRMDSFSPLTRTRTRGGMNAEASAWLGSVDGLLEVHKRLRRVVITSNLATNVIRQQDGKDTLFYLDPPYIADTRTAPDVYLHEMPDADHLEMLDLANECKSKVMISGYDHPMYRSALRPDKWTRVEFNVANSSGSGEKKQRRTECLWCSFRPSR